MTYCIRHRRPNRGRVALPKTYQLFYWSDRADNHFWTGPIVPGTTEYNTLQYLASGSDYPDYGFYDWATVDAIRVRHDRTYGSITPDTVRRILTFRHEGRVCRSPAMSLRRAERIVTLYRRWGMEVMMIRPETEAILSLPAAPWPRRKDKHVMFKPVVGTRVRFRSRDDLIAQYGEDDYGAPKDVPGGVPREMMEMLGGRTGVVTGIEGRVGSDTVGVHVTWDRTPSRGWSYTSAMLEAE